LDSMHKKPTPKNWFIRMNRVLRLLQINKRSQTQ
jgi:hypothetical protein